MHPALTTDRHRQIGQIGGLAYRRQGAHALLGTTQLAAPESAVNLNMGTLVGSYESVARMLDEVAEVPDTAGVLLTFDDFVQGMEDFGTKIQPLMACRKHVKSAA